MVEVLIIVLYYDFFCYVQWQEITHSGFGSWALYTIMYYAILLIERGGFRINICLCVEIKER
jgi:hypothetical protein